MYSAINNCTTVKQVLDNAATWQRMVKNNLIVYCIEQSDDFMRTLADYPDRLYELVSNKYMQTLIGKSTRLEQHEFQLKSPKGSPCYLELKDFLIVNVINAGDNLYGKYRSIYASFNNKEKEFNSKEEFEQISYLNKDTTLCNSLYFLEKNYGESKFVFTMTYYDLSKPTI